MLNLKVFRDLHPYRGRFDPYKRIDVAFFAAFAVRSSKSHVSAFALPKNIQNLIIYTIFNNYVLGLLNAANDALARTYFSTMSFNLSSPPVVFNTCLSFLEANELIRYCFIEFRNFQTYDTSLSLMTILKQISLFVLTNITINLSAKMPEIYS